VLPVTTKTTTTTLPPPPPPPPATATATTTTTTTDNNNTINTCSYRSVSSDVGDKKDIYCYSYAAAVAATTTKYKQPDGK
jgi:hypothetical protein